MQRGGSHGLSGTLTLFRSQTSPASGKVNQMGKGYVQWKEIAGTDLKSHIEAGFSRKVCSAGLEVGCSGSTNDGT